MEFVADNWYLFVALVFILFMLFGSNISLALSGIKGVSASQAVQLLNHNDAVMVDVNEANEYQQGHIPGTVNIPLSKLTNRLNELEKYKSRPVIMVCRSGNRSGKAGGVLRKNGFETVYNLSGGNTAWQRENLPLEK